MTAEQLRRVREMAQPGWCTDPSNSAALAAVLARLEQCEKALAECQAFAEQEWNTARRNGWEEYERCASNIYTIIRQRTEAALEVRP